MSRSIKVKRSTNIGQQVKATCSSCNGDRNHEVLSGSCVDGKDYYTPEDYFGWKEQYEVIRCLGCDNIAFRKTYEDEDSYEFDERLNERVYVQRVSIYPKPEGRLHGVRDKHLLPPQLIHIYDETLESLNSGHTVISGIGIRAIIETVCKDQNTTGRDLFTKINELKDNNILSQSGVEILQKLRVLGNNAAHDVQKQDIEQLKLAFDVIDNIVHIVYVLPQKTAQVFGTA
ncbi:MULTISPECIES: DUF4145 domain-containing protein [Vibrio]|uniref:DUF4145 domain-containing protein n=1 Tax=Vibrio TaxID=662 RepID=UPI000248364F|nr:MULTISPECIES: DUF4145 domain-containing protein [Vibrio]MCZ4374282.1 DUF4145 domain-containing protein [Vibrio diazotrophicus]